MNRLVLFWRSTLGKKVVMAVTGLIMIGFLVSHMLSNLLVFQGPEKLNGYAVLLRKTGALLWLARGGLLASLVLHVVAAVQLTLQERAARPVDNQQRTPQAATWASRTLRWGGVLLGVFLVYHLLHLTWGTAHPDFYHLQPYHNVLIGFQSPLVVLGYEVALLALMLHLYHGAWSSLRSLGAARNRPDPFARPVAAALALLLWAGFAVVPVAVLLGWIG